MELFPKNFASRTAHPFRRRYRVFTEEDFIQCRRRSTISRSIPRAIRSTSAPAALRAISPATATASVWGGGHGVSFGRYLNSVGEEQFPAQVATTFPAINAGPVVGSVVISEIMYHPEVGGDEFIELRNITASGVALFDSARPTNTWRMNGLAFTFPTNIVIPSNGLLLLAATNPMAFRAKYSVPGAVQILGPFTGALQDSGSVELQRPELRHQRSPYHRGEVATTTGAVAAGGDGGGPSLQRQSIRLRQRTDQLGAL